MNEENLISRRQKGAMASHLYGPISEYFEIQRKETLSNLMVKYRQGELEHVGLVSGIAVLCVLEDIENKIKQDINRGERAAKEIIENADK